MQSRWKAFSLAVSHFARRTAPSVLRPLLVTYRWMTKRRSRRKIRHLAQGIPAVLALLGVLLIGGMARNRQPNLEQTYRAAGFRAFQQQDYEAARVYYERVNLSETAQASDRYNLALTLAHLDKMDRATAIMAKLASSGSDGHPKSHLWLANRLLRQPTTFDSPDLLRQAHRHLLAARRDTSKSAEISLKLAQVHAALGNSQTAVDYLTEAARSKTELYFDLANLYGQRGQLDRARQASEKARDHYLERLEEDPYNDSVRLRAASILMNLGDFDSAVGILREGVRLNPDGPYRKTLAEAFVIQFDRQQTRSDANPMQQLDLLRAALEVDSENRSALTRLIGLGDNSPSESEHVKELLRNLLASGHATGFVYFALGCRAWQEEDADQAVWHLERAYKLDEDLGVIGNNLAWALAHQAPADLHRALRVIDSVIQRWPDTHQYRDTRGQILVKLERWEQALDDLERALPAMADNVRMHEALAKIHQELGNQSMSAKHAAIAKHLAQKNPK